MRFESGSRLGPYEITGLVGAGGMGEVYRARDTRLGREVAIKVLPKELSADVERLTRFEREARSSSALNHRNIVTIHDFSSRDGEVWLVMELIKGESLRQVLARGAMPMKRLLSIAAGVADGLAAAHAAGIVHRDLKPENIMITTDGTPKLLDFGLVKRAAVVDTDSPTDLQVSHSGMVLGTAQYMSPEQARGSEVDFRSDHFSFGLILSEMATGTHPFLRRTGVETLAAILSDDPPPLGDAFPEAFVAIVERCLAKDPSQRYGSTADLAHDLARIRDRASGALPGAAPAAMTPQRRSPVWLFIGLVAALAIALAAARFWPRQAMPAPDPIYVSISTPEISRLQNGEVAPSVLISPDGSHLLLRAVGVDGASGLWLHDLRGGSTKLLTREGWLAGWSPDGKSIAYFSEGKLKTVSIAGGPPRTVCAASPEGMPAWSGDTILFAQYSHKPGIYAVSASGGDSRLIIPAETRSGRYHLPWWPHFLPDGKRFIYISLSSQPMTEIVHESYVASVDGKSVRSLGQIDSRAIYMDGYLLFVRDGTLLAQPFDPDAARFTGEARPLVDGVWYFRSTGLGAFSVSNNGLLAWAPAQQPLKLAWVDRTGVESSPIAVARFGAGGRLSPDGKRYAAGIVDEKQGVADIWIYDLARENPERLTLTLLDEKSPVWSPDGRDIYYRADGGGPPDIFRLIPGAEKPERIYSGPGVEEPHDVSPDGKWMLFINYFATGTDINLLPLNPKGPARKYVATPFNETSPRFSPDGKWVAYASDVSGTAEVYVRPFEGTAPSTRVSKEGGMEPRWRRDGKELFFLAPRGRVMSLSFDGASIGTPRSLFQAVDVVDYEPAADGSRFLMQLDQRASTAPVHLLVNWKSRLRP